MYELTKIIDEVIENTIYFREDEKEYITENDIYLINGAWRSNDGWEKIVITIVKNDMEVMRINIDGTQKEVDFE